MLLIKAFHRLSKGILVIHELDEGNVLLLHTYQDVAIDNSHFLDQDSELIADCSILEPSTDAIIFNSLVSSANRYNDEFVIAAGKSLM